MEDRRERMSSNDWTGLTLELRPQLLGDGLCIHMIVLYYEEDIR